MREKLPGHILVFTLAILGILLILTTAAINLIRYDLHLANKSYRVKQARHIAEAGIDLGIRRLNEDSNYIGESDISLGDGTVSIIVSGSGSNRTIEALSYIPNSTNLTSKRKITVDAHVNSDNVEFFYGIQVGEGGLDMTSNTQVIGNIYSNGNVTGSSNASISGDVVVAGGISDNPSLEWTSLNDDNFIATTNGNRDVAQSFIAPVTEKISKISVFLAKVNNPNNNINVRIAENDSDDTPKNNSIESGVIYKSSVGTTASWIDVSFGSPATLSAGQKYWIILDNSSSSSTDHWNWREDNTDGYANNTSMFTSRWDNSSASWSSLNSDLGFKVWLGGEATKIDGLVIGNSTSGTGTANSFVNTTIHGSNCPNQYCIVDNPPNIPLPISDGLIQDWRNDATAGGTISGNYSLSGNQTDSLGPKKIDGNLSLDSNAELTITGTVYVTGDISLSSNCVIKLDPGYGSSSGVLITDGKINVGSNCTFSGAGVGSYLLSLSDNDDKINPSIAVSGNSAGVIYYASKGIINFSSNATAKEATAWRIEMNSNAIVTYESGLASSSFSSGPGGGWTVKRSTWRETRIF